MIHYDESPDSDFFGLESAHEDVWLKLEPRWASKHHPAVVILDKRGNVELTAANCLDLAKWLKEKAAEMKVTP